MGASLARRRHAAPRPAASRRAAQRQREAIDDRLPTWKTYPLGRAGMMLEGAASSCLAPLPHGSPPSPSLVPLSRDRGPLVWRSGGRAGAARRA